MLYLPEDAPSSRDSADEALKKMGIDETGFGCSAYEAPIQRRNVQELFDSRIPLFIPP
jgi:hypothetical protein